MIGLTRFFASLAIACLTLTLLGCAANGPRGHLVIVGGGLSDSNAKVFRAFVDHCASGPIGIVPTASGDGIAAGESNVARFRRFCGDRPIIVIPLTQFDSAKSEDKAVADLISSCGGLWFTGGDQSRVAQVFRPSASQSSAIHAACHAVLNRDGVIGGTSAGAAIMTDPMITGGRALAAGAGRDPENDAATPGVRIGIGMGFLGSGITDQHFLERARMGRLIEALALTGQRFGYGISEDCAMTVDRSSGRFVAHGELGVIIVNRGARGTLRLSAFSTGDRGQVEGAWHAPASGCILVQSNGSPAPSASVTRVFSRESISQLVRALGDGASSVAVRDPDQLVTIKRDRSTRVYRDPVGKRAPMIVDAILMVEPAGESSP